jgi:hypothetical protein
MVRGEFIADLGYSYQTLNSGRFLTVKLHWYACFLTILMHQIITVWFRC